MICLSTNGPSSFLTDAPSDVLLVATAKGIARLENQANGWSFTGRSLEDYYISALMWVPEEDLLFASAHRGTISVSRDRGRTWATSAKGITSRHVYCLNYVRIRERIKLYAGTEPPHLFESDDLGGSWREIPGLSAVPNVDEWDFPGPPHIAHVKNVSLDPWDPHVIYVCVEQGGVYRSSDLRTWTHISQGIYKDVHRLVICPSNPNRLYVPGGDGLYGSIDGGKHWEHLVTRGMTITYPDALLVHPRYDKLMYMAGAATTPLAFEANGTADAHIARSQDAGRTWEILRDGLPRHIRGNVEAMSMEVWSDDPRDGYRIFAGTTDGDIFCSEEGGRRWTQIFTGLPPISKIGHYELLAHGAANFEKRRKAG